MKIDIPESDRDAETETMAALIGDLVYLLPPAKRANAIALAFCAEDAEADRRGDPNRPKLVSKEEFLDGFMDSFQYRHWNDLAELKARAIYLFTREITNTRSREEAARLLFQQHRRIPGSGFLSEYLSNANCADKMRTS